MSEAAPDVFAPVPNPVNEVASGAAEPAPGVIHVRKRQRPKVLEIEDRARAAEEEAARPKLRPPSATRTTISSSRFQRMRLTPSLIPTTKMCFRLSG